MPTPPPPCMPTAAPPCMPTPAQPARRPRVHADRRPADGQHGSLEARTHHGGGFTAFVAQARRGRDGERARTTSRSVAVSAVLTASTLVARPHPARSVPRGPP